MVMCLDMLLVFDRVHHFQNRISNTHKKNVLITSKFE